MNRHEHDTIVIGVDGSPGARNAVRWGLEVAERRRAPVRLIRAYARSRRDMRDGGTPEVGVVGDCFDAVRAQLDATYESARISHPSLTITPELIDDSASSTLIDASQNADIVVIGAHGVRGFRDVLAGSTTMNVATHAQRTVVAMPDDEAAAFRGAGIVVGVDGSEISETAISWAFQLASETGEPLSAAHAWTNPVTPTSVMTSIPAPYDPEAYSGDRELLLAESLAGWAEKYPDVAVSRHVVDEDPVTALTRAAAGARMLVVGCRGRGRIRAMLLGSVSHGVLHLAKCPVAVVHDHR
jgi:nucleotide-binding universal stress UspA family protein